MAGQSIHVEYNEDLKALEQLLSEVKREGNFFANGAAEIPMPKIEVEGVGLLSFPVPPAQTVALIAQATRAPYGRGEATIHDESVRKVWQVAPEKVRIAGKSWAGNFDRILAQIIAGLGCEGFTVSAELYKLLVYEKGDFFLAHRDTEKSGGMFGTLVIGLPSAHRGGELVLRHAGREVVIDMSGAEVSEVAFAAFYADCEHEVRPLTEGNRVCLIYNLIQEREKDGGLPLQAPDYEKQIAAAAEMLEKNLSVPGAPAKVAWLLEHHYSPEGLAFAALKGADAARAKVLARAADRAGCAAYLGIVHIEESGAAQPEYNPRSRGRGWYRHDYAMESQDVDSQNFEIIDICDSRRYVNQWRDLKDQPVALGEIPLAEGELLPAGALDNQKPDQQLLTEASGNEGASFERSYRRAALVVWRRDRYAEVLLQAGVAVVLPYLKECIERANEKDAPCAAREESVGLARRIVDAWKIAPEYSVRSGTGGPEARNRMLRLLNQLGDAALLAEFVAEVVMRDYDGSENAALVAGARLLDSKTTGRLLSELAGHHMPRLHGCCVDLLSTLLSKRKALAKKEDRAALLQIAKAVVTQLNEVEKQQTSNEWPHWRESQQARQVNAALVAKLLDALGDLEAAALRDAAVKEFISRPRVFDPVTILTPAVAVVRHRDAGLARLWEHCSEFLLARSGEPPIAPTDWRQDIKISCSCADCRELQAFTRSPAEQTHRFRARQDRRQHLQGQIERDGLDMTCVTDRKGSPQTLVCTKDRRTYKRRCEQYRKDIAALAALAEQAHNTSPGSAGALKRIEAARALASKWQPI